ncbi:unnamed protein product [Eruca vesicaria subsp. sativa]|uniref:Protein PHYTOCHROME KINASE SUBSTRATE 1-like n=1 Tax=Eruca vesicaria subsp. sativa TaxID=29727 RepID=A0ABC8LUN8_ERUVS|nr:unnamed protein product [Eruca vesicaria subsp. sativa]
MVILTPKTSFDFTKNSNNSSLSVPVLSSSSASSSYLRSKEETKKLMEPCKTLDMNINPKQDQELGHKMIMVKKAPEDPEIGVFGAEKYFNGDMDSDQSSSVLSLTNPEVERFHVDSKQSENKSTGTPSVLSESSWNSQSILLQNKLVKNCNSSLHDKKNNKKSFLSNLGCKFDVDDKISVKRSNDQKIHTQDELVQRKSPKVFGSRIEEEEDTKSDSGSDLFEIENLTEKPKHLLTRQGSDPASPTCYTPSEVSIEWSIVTASVADFSCMSECATSPVRRNRSSQIPNTAKNAPERSSSSRRGGFLSCKSDQSVMVSSGSDKRSNMNKTSPSYVPRFSMETTKPKSFETRRRISNNSITHTPSSLMYSQY